MEVIDASIRRALKASRILPRPNASPGAWVSFLLPTAVIVSSLRGENPSHVYKSSAIYSFNMILNVLHLFFHIYKYNSVNLMQAVNVLCVIPISVTVLLYVHFLDFDLRRSLCYAVANALIYFEGLPFILKVFPKTFTFGEANFTVQGLSLFLYTLFLQMNNILLKSVPETEYDFCTVILQMALSWILIFCVLLYTHSTLRKNIAVYLCGFSNIAFIYFSISYALNLNLLDWVWSFLWKVQRIKILILWVFCSAIAIGLVFRQINKKKKGDTVSRKYFHVLAVIVFLSGIFFDACLIYFSSGCVFGIYIVLEVFRILQLPPLYEFLERGFSIYHDDKDSGILALTPVCLLVGSALPLWLHPLKNYSEKIHLELLSGVMSVGIGDTFASIGGKNFGKHKWKDSNKTVEGTVFSILSQSLFYIVMVLLGYTQWNIKAIAAIFFISIIEAKTDQIDNIVLPLIMYISLIM